MDSACVYEEKIVIHELSQGIQMANQLRVNLRSPEIRDFLIQKILSSYERALFVLQSGHSAELPPPPSLSAPSLPESSISKKRKGSPTWEDQVRTCKGLEGNIVPSSTSFGVMEDYHQLHFPNNYNEELLQVYSPHCISPDTSESNLFTEWGSSPSLDFPADLADVPLDFEFIRSLF